MTPAEKAEELFHKYYDYVPRKMAKELAIICVEQIIEVAWWSSTDEMPEPYRKSQKEYWQEVLSHLQNS